MRKNTGFPSKGQVEKELTRGPRCEWSPVCKIYVCNQAEPTDLCGSGVLVYDQEANVKDTERSKYCIITSNKVIENRDFAQGDYRVEFSKSSRQKLFDLFDVRKSVQNIPSAGLVIIYINPSCKELRHFWTGKCRILSRSTCLTIAERHPDQQSFCNVANQRYVVKSDSNVENGKHSLEAANNHLAYNAAKGLEKADGTVILQKDKEGEEKAVGIFNVVHKTQMEISPMWFKSKITDILGTATPTTDGGQMPSASDTATPSTDSGQTYSASVVTTADRPQSATVCSRDAPVTTTDNQGLPAAGSDHTTEAAAPPSTTDGGQTSSTSDPATSTTDGGQTSSTSDPATSTTDGRQTSSTSDPATSTTDGGQTSSTSDPATSTTDGGQMSSTSDTAAGSDHTTEVTANHQPTAGPSGTDSQQNSANPPNPPPPNGPGGVDGNGPASEYDVNNGNQQPDSITRPPVQEEYRGVHTRTVDNDLPRDPSDRGEASTGTQRYENLPVSRKDTSLVNKLAVGLDRTSHRVIKDWNNLACTEEIKAPPDVCLRCGINSKKSCTQLLFNILTAEFTETTLEDMINALSSIRRNDVKRIITDCYPSDEDQEIKFSDFAKAKSDLIFEMTSLLDQESRVISSWRNLGRSNPFKLTEERLDEIGLPQSTQVLMEYLYKRDDFSIGIFYDKVKELGREDVVKILDKFMNEREISRGTPMEAVITLGDKTMRSICVCFNKSIPGTKDWKHLAKSFDVPESIYKDCVPERPKSPTETLFEWIFAEKDPQLTVGQLCNALKSIDRNDLVKDVREYYEQQSTRQP